jgi:hypothetical protein
MVIYLHTVNEKCKSPSSVQYVDRKGYGTCQEQVPEIHVRSVSLVVIIASIIKNQLRVTMHINEEMDMKKSK